jgi:hypothetical protein
VVTEGSWVRLADRSGIDLRQYVGQQVTVSGSIADTGENTIGTSGTTGAETPSGDKSQAAQTGQHHSSKVAQEAGRIGRESLADGTAPQLNVENVNATGERCGK